LLNFFVLKQEQWDELDELLQVERPETNDKPFKTMPTSGLPLSSIDYGAKTNGDKM